MGKGTTCHTEWGRRREIRPMPLTSLESKQVTPPCVHTGQAGGEMISALSSGWTAEVPPPFWVLTMDVYYIRILKRVKRHWVSPVVHRIWNRWKRNCPSSTMRPPHAAPFHRGPLTLGLSCSLSLKPSHPLTSWMWLYCQFTLPCPICLRKGIICPQKFCSFFLLPQHPGQLGLK